MTQAEGTNLQLFEQSDLTQLNRVGASVLRAAKALEDSPVLLEDRTDEWHDKVLNLKESVLRNEDLTSMQRAACLDTLDVVQPGTKKSEIIKMSDVLATQYEELNMMLTEPNILIMGHNGALQGQSDSTIFKTMGTGLELWASDSRDENFKHGLYIRVLNHDGGGEQLVPIRTESLRNTVTDPESASKLHDPKAVGFDEYRKKRLIVGAKNIAMSIAADKYHGLPLFALRQAREMGVKLEDLAPQLKERFSAECKNKVRLMAQDICNIQVELVKIPEHKLVHFRSEFENIEFLGGTKIDIDNEIARVLENRTKAAYDLLESATKNIPVSQ